LKEGQRGREGRKKGRKEEGRERKRECEDKRKDERRRKEERKKKEERERKKETRRKNQLREICFCSNMLRAVNIDLAISTCHSSEQERFLMFMGISRSFYSWCLGIRVSLSEHS
jgi:hypothetical protein